MNVLEKQTVFAKGQVSVCFWALKTALCLH